MRAILLEEKDLDNLIEKIDELIFNENKLNVIKNNLNQFKIKDSSTKIYNKIKEYIGE